MPKATEKYRPFDGLDDTFELKVDSNKNIAQLGRVLVACRQKDDQERLYYARQCEVSPDSYDEDGNAAYTFPNTYSISTLWPALAQELFYDFPAIVEVQDGEAVIVDEEKHQQLIRSVVMTGRDDFLGRFGVAPYEAERLYEALSSDLNFPIINRIMNPEMPPAAAPKAGTNSSSDDGAPSS